ncbi:Vacuolar protein sorting-associated protein 35 [Boothiomyces sp. JEL0866]|nr:Vacuolar protein sorting-associated protein 35 [Boothiomyces sp. JEL0866]
MIYSYLLLENIIAGAVNVNDYPKPLNIAPCNSTIMEMYDFSSIMEVPGQVYTNSTIPLGCPGPNYPYCHFSCGCIRASDVAFCSNKTSWGLSFDDGPSAATPQILDLLKASGVKATFFIIGSNALKYPDYLLRIYNEGHQVGLHTWSHPALTTVPTENVISEIQYGINIIQSILGVRPVYFRAPYGDLDDRIRAIVAAMRLKLAVWVLDTGDWQLNLNPGAISPASYSYQVITAESKYTNGIVDLGHDLSSATANFAATRLQVIQSPSPSTPIILDYLKAHGLTATFFVVGTQVARYPDTVLRAYNEGHQIGIHTWSHPALTTVANANIVAEIQYTINIVQDIIGVKPLYFRAPYGDTDDRVRSIVAAMGLKNILWGMDTGDFNLYNNPNAITEASFVKQVATFEANKPSGIVDLGHDLVNATANFATNIRIKVIQNSGRKVMSVANCRNDNDPYSGKLQTNTPNGMSPNQIIGTGTPVLTQQPKLLEDALAVVKLQGFHMKKCIETDQLFDALKHASTMLAELKTSSLLPKYYYELYMALFDELRYLTNYLYQAHKSGSHHLSDLYELVQYATNIVPRLYLMLTVGSVYMKVSKEIYESEENQVVPNNVTEISGPDGITVQSPEGVAGRSSKTKKIPTVKEIMNDMLEMSRGVQHPTRGLFLRYYLSGQTRDFLPDCSKGSSGTISDSINFILQNFIEMNKLWVRLQFQGHSRDRERREQERRELRLLVGSNLVRLSQLDETTIEMYQQTILPSLLDEIVSCRDIIAQEYLLDVIIQAFPDEFHIRCLDQYLQATARLQPSVNVKQIVISLIDRFSNYAARAREEYNASRPEGEEGGKPHSGIPDDVKLFDVFWVQINDLILARPEFTIEDVIALLVSLNSLALNCYPERLEYMDRVFGMAREKVILAQQENSDVLKLGNTKALLVQLLQGPVDTYGANLLTILQFPSGKSSPSGILIANNTAYLGGHYTDLLYQLPFGIRRKIAHEFLKAALKANIENGFTISTENGVNFFLGEIASITIRDQIDGNLFGSKTSHQAQENDHKDEFDSAVDWEDVVEEQQLVAKLVHLIKADNVGPKDQFNLLTAARNHFKESGDIRVRFTIAPVVNSMLLLAKSFSKSKDKAHLDEILKGIHSTIGILARAREYYSEEENDSPLFHEEAQHYQPSGKIAKGLSSPPEISLKLYLLGAQVADITEQEEMSYEFLVEAFTVYEEAISESRAQFNAINQIIGTLQKTTVFGFENYETLITKCAVHCSRLLKRADQSRGIALVSPLFWANDSTKRHEEKPAYRNGKRVLECLQKALKIADSVMDPAISVGLFVEILERYLWFFERQTDMLIQNNLANPVRSSPFPSSLGGPLGAPPPPTRNNSRKLLEAAAIHFANILKHITTQKEEHRRSVTSSMPEGDSGFMAKEGRWGDIIVPYFEFSAQ